MGIWEKFIDSCLAYASPSQSQQEPKFPNRGCLCTTGGRGIPMGVQAF